MADDSNYILLSDSQNEDFSDEAVKIIQIPELLTPEIFRSQSKVSWVWAHFIKKQNDKGEMRAYC